MLILKFHIPLPVHAQLKQPQKSVASVTAANEAIKYQQDFKGLAMREGGEMRKYLSIHAISGL